MGALISVCCQHAQPSTNYPNPQPTPALTKKSQTIILHQQQYQEIKTKEQISLRLNNEVKPQEEEFYDIQSFIQEREKSNFQPPKITFDDFEIIGKLGEGSFGMVLQVSLKQQKDLGMSQNYAMKRISRDKMKNTKIVSSVHLERDILATTSHSFITSLKYAFADKYFLYLVMENASGGDVSTFIKNKQRKQAFRRLGSKGVRFIIACTILGLEYLHSRNIIYRDLKVQNILIFDDGYVKLSDFGLAKIVNSQDQLSKTHAGTALYTAPQMVLQSGYNKSVDFWSLGILAYELQTGETPFKLQDVSTKLRFKRVCQQQEQSRKWRGHNLEQNIKDLIGRLLKFKPEDRLGVKNIQLLKSHTYFKQFDWQLLLGKKMQSPLLEIIQTFNTKVQPFQNKNNTQQGFFNQIQSQDSWDFNYNLR